MQKNKGSIFDTRTVVFMAALVAMQIVLSRVLVIDVGFARITLGTVCTIMAGLWFGPVAGGTCGLVADLLGCLLKGYAVNPLISLAAVVWGVVPVLIRSLAKGEKGKKTVFICFGIVLASVISSLVLTTAGLVLMNGYNLMAILPSRAIQWAVMTPVYCVLTCGIYCSPLTSMVHSAAAGHAA